MKINIETQKNLFKYILHNDKINLFNNYTDYFEDEKLNKLFKVLIGLNYKTGNLVLDINILNQELTNIGDKFITDEYIIDVIDNLYTVDINWLECEFNEWYKNISVHKELKHIQKMILDGEIDKVAERLGIEDVNDDFLDDNDTEITTPMIDSEVFEKIPSILHNVIDYADETNLRERDVLLLSSLTVTSSLLDNVGMRWYKTLVDKPNMYLYVASPSGGGKGIMQKSIHLLNEYQDIEEELVYRNALEEYNKPVETEEKGKRKYGDAPVKKNIEIPGNSSKAAIFKSLKNNNGKGLIFMGESESMTSNAGNEWGKFDDILNSSFHNEVISSGRVDETIKIRDPYLSFCASGTLNQLVALLNKSIENGLVSRMSYYVFNSDSKYRRDNGQRFDSDELMFETADEALKHFSKDYHKIFLFYNKYYRFLFDKLRIEITREQVERFDDKLEELYNHYIGIFGKDYDATMKRVTTTTRKILMVLTIIRHYEKNKKFIENSLRKLDLLVKDDFDEFFDNSDESDESIEEELFDNGMVDRTNNLSRDGQKIFNIYNKIMIFNEKRNLFEIFIDDVDLDISMSIMNTIVIHSKYVLSTLKPVNSEDTSVVLLGNETDIFLTELKKVFTSKEAIKIGSKYNLSERTVQRRIKGLIGSKFIKKIKNGIYEKIK